MSIPRAIAKKFGRVVSKVSREIVISEEQIIKEFIYSETFKKMLTTEMSQYDSEEVYKFFKDELVKKGYKKK